MICICGKICKNKNSYAQHWLRCANNQNKLIQKPRAKRGKGNSWNAGLTKESDSRVLKGSLAISATMTGKPGRLHSEETKKKISESRKEFLDKNPEMIPYKLNHSSKQSYPEKYFHDVFEAFDEIVSELRVGRYSLDFANPHNLKYVEIDGEQHYTDKKVKDSDARRALFLSDAGWVGMRIRWSNFKSMSEEDRRLQVSNAIAFLLNK